MIEVFKTNCLTGKLEKTKDIVKGTWINILAPDNKEIDFIAKKLNISEHLLRYSLDLSEKAHIDLEDESVLISVDVPITEYQDNRNIYTTIPLGLILVKDDYFITISQSKIDVVTEIMNTSKEFEICTDKKSRLVFQLLYKIAAEYIKYMSYISRDIDKFEKNMQKSMKNSELLSLLDFEKTMIYFNTSIKANQSVLQKIARGKVIKLYEEDEDILDDTIIENRQAIEMVQTYGEILNGIIDIFGTIVSNNLNTVLKFLTSITIIIAIPTLIASVMGMNVQFPFNTGTIGFYGVMGVMLLVTILTAMFLKKSDML